MTEMMEDANAGQAVVPGELLGEPADWESEQWLDQQWQLMKGLVVPYETARPTYRQRYQRPVIVSMAPVLWRALVSKSSVSRALDLLLLLGFVPLNGNDDDVQLWSDERRQDGIRLRLVLHEPNTKQVSFDEGVAPAERVKDLEQEVKELTKQLRIFKSREASTVSESPELTAPTPHIMLMGKGLMASTAGGSLVCIPVNYLDPDFVPYVVGLSGHGISRLIPCTIVDHRFIVFVAPPANRGSFALTLLCTVGTTLKRYAKSVWLEYKSSEAFSVLSHHAVNQLVHDIALPSSATLGDPSDGPEFKSEAASCVDDQDDAVSECSAGTSAVVEPHLPLTREMLDMIPGGFHQGPGGVSRAPGSIRRSGANSECSEPTIASSMPTFAPTMPDAAFSVVSVASVVSDVR